MVLSLVNAVLIASVAVVPDCGDPVYSSGDREVLEFMVGQQDIYGSVFSEPYDPETDGVMRLNKKPAVDEVVTCIRSQSESCEFLVTDYFEYDSDELLRLAGFSEEAIALEANKPTIGWASGYVFSSHGAAPTSALALTSLDEQGEPIYMMLALADGNAVIGGLTTALRDGSDDTASGGAGLGDESDCDDLNEPGHCAEFASCMCGCEPECDPAPQFPGIWECMRAAGCRRDKCNWAHCMVTWEGVCEGTVKQVSSVSPSCDAIYLAEVAGCLPQWVIGKLKVTY